MSATHAHAKTPAKAASGLTVPALLAGLSLLLSGGSALTETASSDSRYSFTQPQMGVPFRITLYADDPAAAETAADAAFNRIEGLNRIFSDYEPDSELSRLSETAGAGKVIQVSPELWTVLEHAQALARQTDGAFDVTVGPYVELWRHARRTRNLPDRCELAAAEHQVGHRHLKLYPDQQAVELLRSGMQLDLGGIAKGYAVDEALKVLNQHGIDRALISGGGDFVAGESPPERPGWKIGLAELDPTAQPSEFIWLRHQALATSGNMFQSVRIDGKQYSHIVDPRTGIGLTHHILVHLLAEDGMTADSLATVVNVRGPQEGLRFVEDKPEVEARVAWEEDETMKTRMSSGFPVRAHEDSRDSFPK